MDQVIAPMRAQYEELIHNPARIEQTLLAGAERARAVATPFMRELRSAVGLRSLVQVAAPHKADKAHKAALPSFKQYREQDGKFYFKFVAADGRLLLQSTGFDAPKAAGQAIGQLQQALPGAWQDHAAHLQLAEGVSAADVSAALQALTEAAAA